jgi:membrane-bound lytic murein transglycosylase B
MHADADCIARAAEDRRNCLRVEPLPRREQQELSLLVAKLEQGGGDGSFGRLRSERCGDVTLQCLVEPATSPLTANMVCDYPSRRGVQPIESRVALRDPVQAPPGNGECLGNDVRGVIGRKAAKRETEHAVVVRVVELREVPAPLLRSHFGHSSLLVESRSTCYSGNVRLEAGHFMVMLRILLATAVLAATAAAPPPNTPLPTTPRAAATALTQTTSSLRAQIDAWRAHGAGLPAPKDLVLLALYQQRLTRLLSSRPALAAAVLSLLPAQLRGFSRDVIVAHRDLVAITPPLRPHALRVGQPAAPNKLLSYYRAAMRRFGVPWNVLAAVNFVESAFGKLRSSSAAGAQGPMQFMPSTWRTYGLGGDVHNPRDAIMGAANYLRAAGASRSIRHALHAYNPSSLYVDAVLRYARRIGSEIDAFFTFYDWQVFVRTTAGEKRLTGPGIP